MLLGVRQFFERRGAPSIPTARDYMQTGLVAMWDGIENAGWGVHNENATVWNNLIGSSNLIGQSQSCADYWTSDGYELQGNSNTVWIESGDAAANLVSGGTLELVYENANSVHSAPYAGWILSNRGQNDNSETWFSFSGYWWYMFAMPEVNINNTQNGTFAVVNLPSSETYSGKHVFSTTYTDTGDCIGYVNGIQSVSKPNNPNIMAGFVNRNDRKIYLGKDGPRMDDFGKGIVHCIRFYSRPLSSSEILANTAIDKARFNLP